MAAPLFREPSVERPELDALHPHEVYLNLPKGFGDVPSEQLIDIAQKLETSDQPEYVLAAGSALIEATIFSPDRDASTHNSDLFAIEFATLLLEEAAGRSWHNLERGFTHPDDQEFALHADVKAAYSDVYRDIITGTITEESRGKTYAKMAKLGQYCHRQAQYASVHKFRAEASGLTFEIATLMGGLTGEGVLLPATARADNGRYNAEDTYDFNYIELDDDGAIKTNRAIEFKNERNSKRRLAAHGRYQATLINAGTDLRLHKSQLSAIFSNQKLNTNARRELANVRIGLQNQLHTTQRRQGKLALAHCA